MTDLREAAQMALDALEHGLPIIEDFGGKEQIQIQHKAISALYEALRAALAQPENLGAKLRHYVLVLRGQNRTIDGWCEQPEFYLDGNRVYEAQPEPPCKTGSQCVGGKCERCAVQEPVAWITVKETWGFPKMVVSETKKDGWKPVYTAPPQREWQGLTDEEIEKIYLGSFDEGQFARAIEAKLKEKNT